MSAADILKKRPTGIYMDLSKPDPAAKKPRSGMPALGAGAAAGAGAVGAVGAPLAAAGPLAPQQPALLAPAAAAPPRPQPARRPGPPPLPKLPAEKLQRVEHAWEQPPPKVELALPEGAEIPDPEVKPRCNVHCSAPKAALAHLLGFLPAL